MKRGLMIVGVGLLLLGIATILHPTYTYHDKQQVAKIGAFQATVDEEKTGQVPPLAIVALLISGFALILVASRKS